MSITALTGWATTHPGPATAAALTALLVAVGTGWAAVHSLRRATKPSAAVVVAAIAAAACTAYSADTSWRFAEHRLGMTDLNERAAMFAAAELALFACGLMARANMRATATEQTAGSPGTPGMLVWVITGVQIIPAFSESGIVGGTVRAMIGPVLAALLWHLAMGLELRIVRPGALSGGLPAIIARELRERLLSRLGLSVRDRTAEQITRDRATQRAVQLAARLELQGTKTRRGRRTARRLAAAVARAGVGADPNQKQRLMQLLAARRGAPQLATINLQSPWDPPQPSAQPSTPTALARQSLTEMHPFDAIRRVHSAHPDLHPAALASLTTEHGVVVSEQMVRVAIGAGNPARAAVPSAPAPALEPPHPLELDLTPMPEVRAPARAIAADQTRSAVRARIPECAPEPESETPADERPECTPPTDPDAHSDAAHPHSGDDPDAHSDASGRPHSNEDDEDQDELDEDEEEPGEEELPDPDPLLDRARELDRQHQAAKGRPASLRFLQRELRIGQTRAQHLQQLIPEK